MRKLHAAIADNGRLVFIIPCCLRQECVPHGGEFLCVRCGDKFEVIAPRGHKIPVSGGSEPEAFAEVADADAGESEQPTDEFDESKGD